MLPPLILGLLTVLFLLAVVRPMLMLWLMLIFGGLGAHAIWRYEMALWVQDILTLFGRKRK